MPMQVRFSAVKLRYYKDTELKVWRYWEGHVIQVKL